MLKKCTKCLLSKDILDFNKRKYGKHGISSICKLCHHFYHKIWCSNNKNLIKKYQKKYRIKHSDKYKIYMKKYHKIKPTPKNKIKQYTKKYYRNNLEKVKARTIKWRNNNKIKWKMYCSDWTKKNTHIVNEYAQKRRGKKLNQTPPDSIQKVNRLFYKMAQNMTRIMGEKYHVDHRIPISKGGLHHQNNLQVMRGSENLKKGNKIIFEETKKQYK